jgi:hypothetical protein
LLALKKTLIFKLTSYEQCENILKFNFIFKNFYILLKLQNFHVQENKPKTRHEMNLNHIFLIFLRLDLLIFTWFIKNNGNAESMIGVNKIIIIFWFLLKQFLTLKPFLLLSPFIFLRSI